MRTFVGVLVPVLVLLMASSASAQDMSDLVLITVDLHWTVPVYDAVSLSGSEKWQNGVGYTDTTKRDSERWHVTGTGLPSFGWTNFVFPPQFGLVLDLDLPHDELEIRVPLKGQLINPVVRPGDYSISDSVFVQSNFGRSFAESGHISVLRVPELAIMRTFAKHLGGRKLNAFVNPTLQRITAWSAAKILGAPSSGEWVFLPHAYLEVQEWCSGVSSMKWLMLLALSLALVSRASLPWKVALVVAAPLIGLEANILRVTAIGAWIETFGWGIKDWAGWSAMGLGVVQVVGLGWLMNRQRPRTA
jgi:exosortase/archaeosortase family protein